MPLKVCRIEHQSFHIITDRSEQIGLLTGITGPDTLDGGMHLLRLPCQPCGPECPAGKLREAGRCGSAVAKQRIGGRRPTDPSTSAGVAAQTPTTVAIAPSKQFHRRQLCRLFCVPIGMDLLAKEGIPQYLRHGHQPMQRNYRIRDTVGFTEVIGHIPPRSYTAVAMPPNRDDAMRRGIPAGVRIVAHTTTPVVPETSCATPQTDLVGVFCVRFERRTDSIDSVLRGNS